jgi:hypothetical protein
MNFPGKISKKIYVFIVVDWLITNRRAFEQGKIGGMEVINLLFD